MFEELTLTTPSILFSAVSLIMLAYTNRFLAYAQVIRNLKAEHDKNPTPMTQRQIDNLRRRLYLSRAMQIFGASSLLLCVLCTFLIYIGMQMLALYTFAVALLLLVVSLWISIREVIISVKALDVYLDHMKPAAPERSFGRPTPGPIQKSASAGSSSSRSRSHGGGGRSRSGKSPATATSSTSSGGSLSSGPKATYTDPSTLGTTTSTEAALASSSQRSQPAEGATRSSGGSRSRGGRSRGGGGNRGSGGASGSGSGSGTPGTSGTPGGGETA